MKRWLWSVLAVVSLGSSVVQAQEFPFARETEASTRAELSALLGVWVHAPDFALRATPSGAYFLSRVFGHHGTPAGHFWWTSPSVAHARAGVINPYNRHLWTKVEAIGAPLSAGGFRPVLFKSIDGPQTSLSFYRLVTSADGALELEWLDCSPSDRAGPAAGLAERCFDGGYLGRYVKTRWPIPPASSLY
jgi:hypothetical protein